MSLLDLEKVKEEPEIFTFDIPGEKEGAGKEVNINDSSNELSEEFNFQDGGDRNELDLEFEGQLTSIDLEVCSVVAEPIRFKDGASLTCGLRDFITVLRSFFVIP